MEITTANNLDVGQEFAFADKRNDGIYRVQYKGQTSLYCKNILGKPVDVELTEKVIPFHVKRNKYGQKFLVHT